MKKVILAFIVFMLTLMAASCKKEAPPYPVLKENDYAVVYGTDEEKELAENVTSTFANEYVDLSRKFGYKNEEPVELAFCTQDVLREVVGKDYSENTTYGDRDGVFYVLSPSAYVQMIGDEAKKAEYTNNLYYTLWTAYILDAVHDINDDIPFYLGGGILAYESGQQNIVQYQDVIEDLKNSDIPTIKELEKMDSTDEKMRHAYTFIDFIVNEYGYEKLCEFIEKPKVKKVFGMTEEDFCADWLVYAKNTFAKDFENTKETKHFIFNYDSIDRNCFAEMSAILEREYGRITEAFGVTMPQKVKVSIYPTFDFFNKAMFTPQSGYGHLGQAIENEFFIVSTNDVGYGYTKEAMLRGAVHEFVHTVIHYVNDDVPVYLNEGAAAYFAGQNMDFGDTDLHIKYAVNNNALPSFEQVKSITPRVWGQTGYVYGYVLVEYIVTEYGSEKLVELLKSHDYSAVFEKSEEQFYNEWVEWIKEEYCN